jgi:hypothetical protein
MRAKSKIAGAIGLLVAGPLMMPVIAQEKNAEEKKSEEKKAEPAKAKAEKVAGDIGLLDTEKNLHDRGDERREIDYAGFQREDQSHRNQGDES